MSETKENEVAETVVEAVVESVVEEPNGETDIYEAQGYVAIPMEESDHDEEGEDGYFDKGYMTLPDEDPDEDKRTIEYPENYEEIADIQLKMLEAQYEAVLNGTTLPKDDPFEIKKPTSDLLPKPIDIVGEDEEVPKAPKKTQKKKKKEEKKKTWSREEILNTFLPPEKQKALQKTRRTKETAEKDKKEQKPVEKEQKEKKPVEKVKKEKKPVPAVVMKEETKVEEKPISNDEKADLIRSTMSSIQIDHTPAWAQHMSEKEIDEMVKKTARELLQQYSCLLYENKSKQFYK